MRAASREISTFHDVCRAYRGLQCVRIESVSLKRALYKGYFRGYDNGFSIGGLKITYTVWGGFLNDYIYRTMGPPNPILIIKAPILESDRGYM